MERTRAGLLGFDVDVWWLAFSAFFADLGYQIVIAYVGGRIGDHVGRKRTTILGNILIPILSLTGLATAPVTALVLFATGWWA